MRTSDLFDLELAGRWPNLYSARRAERAEDLLEAAHELLPHPEFAARPLPEDSLVLLSRIADRHMRAHGGRWDRSHPISQLANLRTEDKP